MTNSEKSASISILLFGPLAEQVGSTRIEIEATQASDLDALLSHLRAEHPPLRTARFAVAVDEKIHHGNLPLSAGMTVALLPPFSGG